MVLKAHSEWVESHRQQIDHARLTSQRNTALQPKVNMRSKGAAKRPRHKRAVSAQPFREPAQHKSPLGRLSAQPRDEMVGRLVAERHKLLLRQQQVASKLQEAQPQAPGRLSRRSVCSTATPARASPQIKTPKSANQMNGLSARTATSIGSSRTDRLSNEQDPEVTKAETLATRLRASGDMRGAQVAEQAAKMLRILKVSSGGPALPRHLVCALPPSVPACMKSCKTVGFGWHGSHVNLHKSKLI